MRLFFLVRGGKRLGAWHRGGDAIKKTVFKRLAPLGGKRVFENRLNESRRLFYFLRMMVASRSGPTETMVIGVPVAFSIYSM